MFPYSTILNLRKFQFSLSVSTSIDKKVKITIKINPYQKFDVLCVQYSFSSIVHVLLLRNLVEEAKLNNRSTHTLQILHEDWVS